MKPNQNRVVLENLAPVLHGDLYLKKTKGEEVVFAVDVLSDGHDVMVANLLWKKSGARKWQSKAFHPTENDRWSCTLAFEEEGMFEYMVESWIDAPLTWHHGTLRKLDDGQHTQSEFLEGAEYLRKLGESAAASVKKVALQWAEVLANADEFERSVELVRSAAFHELLVKHPSKFLPTTTETYKVRVERDKALFSTWYEFFPRSASAVAGTHGTFKDCEAILPRVAEMGFDTLYFPPVHPIGEVNRKGKNNATSAEPGDVGSPWGIGSVHGGHMSLHPELGDEKSFKSLVKKASELGIEIAMDFALQAAPDHPWVKEHPQWFKWRPDGTVQYAENPPKKYQDILPIYFETSDWKNLWNELLKTALYWVEEFGINVFRVDNPHTKPFNFWGWLIREVHQKHPQVMFLSEAFTRPKIMEQLAKQGFTQGYTYFTWRNSKSEIVQYMTELTQGPLKDYFRPNFWPNTPDINPWHLQGANEAMHKLRYALAGTLSSNVGVYGPVYEFQESAAVPGREEYWDSEKYEVRHWDWNKQTPIMHVFKAVNDARRRYAALQQTNNLEFLPIDNDSLLAFRKWSKDGKNQVIVIISLDPNYKQIGTLQLPYENMGRQRHQNLRVKDGVTGDSYNWYGDTAYIELHPALPFHIFNVEIL
jgi:starch synthase (maltosyl-transferring)